MFQTLTSWLQPTRRPSRRRARPGLSAEPLEDRVVPALVLNEMLIDPAGSDTPNEYIEIRATAGETTVPANTYLVGIEGDYGENLGDVRHVFPLSGLPIGSNGFLVLLQKGSPFTSVVAPGTAVVQNTGTGDGWGNGASSSIGHTADGGATELSNASITYLLIQAETAPTLSIDIDTANTGIPNAHPAGVYPGWTILDGVGITDGTVGPGPLGGPGDRAYGFFNAINPGGTGLAFVGKQNASMSTFTWTGFYNFTSGYVGRYSNSTGWAAWAWMGAETTTGTAPNFSLGFAAFIQGFAHHALDHLGARNFPNAYPTLDLNGSLGPGFDHATTFRAGGGPVLVAHPDLYVYDNYTTPSLTGVTVTITNLKDPGAELLAATATGPITGSYDGTTGVLTLTGEASAVAYRDVLKTLTYNNVAALPDATPRVVTLVLSDAYASSPVRTSTITMDIGPDVLSVKRAGPNPTGATSVDYTVKFDGPVTGVGPSDFALTTTGGLTGASITRLSGSGATYTVTVATGPGEGTVRLDVVDRDTILDDRGYPLGGPGAGNGNFTAGEAYTIDRTPPTVLRIEQVTPDPTSEAYVEYRVVFSEYIQGVDSTDFALTATGVTDAFVDFAAAYQNTAQVFVYTGAGNGTIRLDLIDDDTITDFAGNPLAGPGAGNGNATGPEYHVTEGNPTVDLPSGPALYTEGDPPVPVDPEGTGWDDDSFNIAGGTLTVDFAANGTADDRLDFVPGPGALTIPDPGVLAIDGAVIGTFTGGVGLAPLVVNFIGPASRWDLDPVIRAVAFWNVSENPSTLDRTVRFVVTDGDGGTSEPATQGVRVREVNDPPTATGETLTNVAEDSGPRSIPFADLLANDSPGPGAEAGQSLTITAVDTAVGGTVSIVGGNVEFSPAADFNGTASFRYTVRDNGTTAGAADPRTATATATFTITEVNDDPVAADDTLASSVEGAARTIPLSILLANDTPGPGNEGGQALTVTAVGSAVGGTVAIVGSDVVFTPTPGFNGAASFVYTVRDNGTTNGAAAPRTDTATVRFTVTEVNDPPAAADDVLSSVPEDSGPRTIPAADLLANDTPGAANEGGQTLTIIAVDSPVGGTVRLQGGSVVFTPAAEFSGTARFRYTVRDNGTTNGAADPLTASATVTFPVTPVNDDPVIGQVGGVVPYRADDPPVVVDADGTVSDVDSSDFDGGRLTVRFASGGQGEDVLAVGTVGQIGVSEAGVTFGGVLIGTRIRGPGLIPLTVALNAAATPAAVQALVRAVTFATPWSPQAVGGPRVVEFRVTDGDGGTSNLPTVTVQVDTNRPPVLTLSAGPVTFTENAPPQLIDPAAAVSDPNATDFDGGTLTVSLAASGSADDRLGVRSQGTGAGLVGVTGGVVTFGGVPVGTLSGGDAVTPLVVAFNSSATAAVVEAVARNVVFLNISDAPVPGPRTVQFVLTDGDGGTSTPAARTVEVVAVNDLPVNTPPSGPLVTDEEAVLTIAGFSVADPDVGAGELRVHLTVTGGRLTLGGTSGLAVLGNGTSAVTAVGSVAALNAGLGRMVFAPAADFFGGALVQILTDDQAGPTVATDLSITVNPINDPPVNTLPGPGAAFEDITKALGGVRVTDVDSGTNAIVVTLTVTAGTLTVRTDVFGGLTAAEVTGNGTGRVVLSAPVDRIDATLSAPVGLVYNAPPNFNGSVTLGMSTTDQGATGAVVGTDTDSITMTVSPVNDEPTFALLTDLIEVGEDAGRQVVGRFLFDISPGPADEAAQATSVSVSTAVTSGNLVFTAAPAIDRVTGALTFTAAPDTNGTARVTVTVRDTGSGVAPNDNTATRTFTLSVYPVNDPPSFTLAGNPPAGREDSGPQTVADFARGFVPGPATATDEAGQTPTYVVRVISTTPAMRFAAGPAISPAGVLTYSLAPDAYGTATVGVAVRDGGGRADGGQDLSAEQTFTITATGVNDPPTSTSDQTVVVRGGGPTTIDVLGNDTAAPDLGERLTITGVDQPPRGTVSIAPGGASLVYTPRPNFTGVETFTYTVSDGSGGTATATATVTVTVALPEEAPLPVDLIAFGSASGPQVRVYNATTGVFVGGFDAFPAGFTGGVNVAVGDLNGDTVPDVIVGAGPGGGPIVRVVDGTKLGQVGPDAQILPSALLADYFAYHPDFRGGLSVAAADINADGRADLVLGAGDGGGPHVKVVNGFRLGEVGPDGQVADAALLGSFFAYHPGFRGGVNVAAADVNGDRHADIITGAAASGDSHVKVIDGTRYWLVAPDGQVGEVALLASFFAFLGFYGGVNVAAGDLNADGRADVITAVGPGSIPHVKVYSGRTSGEVASFLAFEPDFRGGSDVGFRMRADGTPLLLAGAGVGGGRVRVYAGMNLDPLESVFAFDPGFIGGVDVG